MKAQNLKSLQTESGKIKKEIDVKNEEVIKLQKEIEKLKTKYNQIVSQIARMSKKDLVVSEHALLRFIERHFQINLKDIEEMIATPEIKKIAEKINSGKFPLTKDLKIVLKDNVIVTVEPN